MNLNVKVQPHAKRNTVEVSDDGALTIRVTAAPDRGKANAAAIKLLASSLRVPKSSVSIIRGHTSRNKVVRVDGIEDAELNERLTSIRRVAAVCQRPTAR